MTVAFFISGHGFGHASRQVEIINALAAARPGVGIGIRSAVDAGLLARTLRTPADLRPGPCDSGIVQSSSVAHDDEATTRATRTFYGTYASRVQTEVAALRDNPPAVIVGDIPPLAFDVAARLGIPSIAIANFTWDWIYATHPGLDRDTSVLETIRAGYRKATLALELPLSAGFDVFTAVEPLPLVARRPTRSRGEARAYFGVPADRPMALLSFGGLNFIHAGDDARFGLLAGRFVGEVALLRFYVLHCLGLPLAAAGLMAVHFWRVRKDGGISGPL